MRLWVANSIFRLIAGGVALAGVLSAPYAYGQVKIGGDYSSEVTTGSIKNEAIGENAKASRCVGGIAGDVTVAGKVTSIVNGQEQTSSARCITSEDKKRDKD